MSAKKNSLHLKRIARKLHDRGLERTPEQVLSWIIYRLKKEGLGWTDVPEALELLDRNADCFQSLCEQIRRI